MNFWTFLDRNAGGMGLIIVIALCFWFGECGDNKNREGCRLQCGDAVHRRVQLAKQF